MFTRRGTVRRRDGTAGRRVNISFFQKNCTWVYLLVIQYCTEMYSTVQYCTVLYSTVQYCTALYSTENNIKLKIFQKIDFLRFDPMDI